MEKLEDMNSSGQKMLIPGKLHTKGQTAKEMPSENVRLHQQFPCSQSGRSHSPNFVVSEVRPWRGTSPLSHAHVSDKMDVKGRKPYTLSPAATVEYIRAQMRDTNSQADSSVLAAGKHRTKALDVVSAEREHGTQCRLQMDHKDRFTSGFHNPLNISKDIKYQTNSESKVTEQNHDFHMKHGNYETGSQTADDKLSEELENIKSGNWTVPRSLDDQNLAEVQDRARPQKLVEKPQFHFDTSQNRLGNDSKIVLPSSSSATAGASHARSWPRHRNESTIPRPIHLDGEFETLQNNTTKSQNVYNTQNLTAATLENTYTATSHNTMQAKANLCLRSHNKKTVECGIRDTKGSFAPMPGSKDLSPNVGENSRGFPLNKSETVINLGRPGPERGDNLGIFTHHTVNSTRSLNSRQDQVPASTSPCSTQVRHKQNRQRTTGCELFQKVPSHKPSKSHIAGVVDPRTHESERKSEVDGGQLELNVQDKKETSTHTNINHPNTGISYNSRNHIPTNTNTGINYNSRNHIPTNTNTGINHNSRNHIPTNTNIGINYNSRNHIPTNTNIGINHNSRNHIPTNTNTGINHNSKNHIPTNTNTGINHNSRNNIPTNTNTGINYNSRNHIPTNTKTGIRSNPKSPEETNPRSCDCLYPTTDPVTEDKTKRILHETSHQESKTPACTTQHGLALVKDGQVTCCTRINFLTKEPVVWCPNETFATSTPLRQSHQTFRGDATIMANFQDVTRTAGDGNDTCGSQTHLATRTPSDLQSHHDMVNRITGNQAVCTYKVSDIPEARTRTVHTPSWEDNLFPKAIKAVTGDHRRGRSERPNSTQKLKSAPVFRRHRGRSERLEPVNLFPEIIENDISVQKKRHENALCLQGKRSESAICVQGKRSENVFNVQENKDCDAETHNSREGDKARLGFSNKTFMSEFANGRSVTQGVQRKDACAFNTLRNSKLHPQHLVKEGANLRRHTDLPSSLSRHTRTMLDQQSTDHNELDSSKQKYTSLHRFRDSQSQSLGPLFQQVSRSTTGTRERRSSLGVLRAKSADIAAIYSRLIAPVDRANLWHGHLHSSGRRTESRLKYPALQEETDSVSRQRSAATDQISVRESDFSIRPFSTKQTNRKFPSSYSTHGHTESSPGPGDQSLVRDLKFDEEEFCSADVFLADLQKSFQTFVLPDSQSSACFNKHARCPGDRVTSSDTSMSNHEARRRETVNFTHGTSRSDIRHEARRRETVNFTHGTSRSDIRHEARRRETVNFTHGTSRSDIRHEARRRETVNFTHGTSRSDIRHEARRRETVNFTHGTSRSDIRHEARWPETVNFTHGTGRSDIRHEARRRETVNFTHGTGRSDIRHEARWPETVNFTHGTGRSDIRHEARRRETVNFTHGTGRSDIRVLYTENKRQSWPVCSLRQVRAPEACKAQMTQQKINDRVTQSSPGSTATVKPVERDANDLLLPTMSVSTKSTRTNEEHGPWSRATPQVQGPVCAKLKQRNDGALRTQIRDFQIPEIKEQLRYVTKGTSIKAHPSVQIADQQEDVATRRHTMHQLQESHRKNQNLPPKYTSLEIPDLRFRGQDKHRKSEMRNRTRRCLSQISADSLQGCKGSHAGQDAPVTALLENAGSITENHKPEKVTGFVPDTCVTEPARIDHCSISSCDRSGPSCNINSEANQVNASSVILDGCYNTRSSYRLPGIENMDCQLSSASEKRRELTGRRWELSVGDDPSQGREATPVHPQTLPPLPPTHQSPPPPPPAHQTPPPLPTHQTPLPPSPTHQPPPATASSKLSHDMVSTDQTWTFAEPVRMERKKGTAARNRNVFKGSLLVSLLVESHPKHFPSRAVACKFSRRLLREGYIQGISGAKDFQDSAQLYMWHDQDLRKTSRRHDMTSTPSSSLSNPNSYSKSGSKSHRQLDWQLIQDIRNKLLNRSEAYNIVTSYNTFIRELEHDFGYDHGSPKKSPSGESDVGWSGTNTPHTSTLEHKKDTVYSTDSSLDTQTYFGKSKNSGKHRKKQSKHAHQNPHGTSSPSKNDLPVISHEASPHLNHNQEQNKTTSQPYHHHYHHHQAAPEMSKELTRKFVIPEERLSEPNFSLEQSHASPGNPVVTKYENSSNQYGAATNNHVTSATAANHGNDIARSSEPDNAAIIDRGVRWPQEEPVTQQFQSVPPEMQKWLDPEPSHFSGHQRWISENSLHRERAVLVGQNKSRWPESVASDGADSARKWPENANSYSDNEKQLLEEMRRMKKEHQNVLRTYESRINKLMAKMHELRNIAEMLEHSSNKSSPYGDLPGKLALLSIFGSKSLDGNKVVPESAGFREQAPPPLPPRPGRGSRVYPNKPIIHTSVRMRPLPWSRIILENDMTGRAQTATVWQGMTEPKIDTEELQRLFSSPDDFPNEVNLYDDICLRRGRNQSQIISVYDAERSQRIVSELRALHCTLSEVIQTFLTLNCDGLHIDSFAELLELLASQRELDKILHHVKKRGAGHLDAPEYLVFELSKVDHFRERLEFLRFKNKIQINLFEIDQQLRELQTACDEIMTSAPLKHVLETVLAVGNHMNAGTDQGQADGFKMDVLNTLKDMQDSTKQCSLLELVMRIYCLKFEADLGLGCPSRFLLPEPSNMRHAAQVSFEDIQRALKELKDELMVVRNKLESLSKQEGNTLTIALRVTSESFITSAMEVLAEEHKILEDTRALFKKTAAYFSYEGQKVSPRDFFQIWASFLHDCKYYWKLAHRNLAKAKFNTDLVTKNQLSSSSLPGFNSLKSTMMKHVASFQQGEIMRASKSQQLQHINSWIQSVGKYTMEMQSEGIAGTVLEAKNSKDYHSGFPQENKHQNVWPQRHQEDDHSISSPPYKNQQFPSSKNSINAIIESDRQAEEGGKQVLNSMKTVPSKSSKHNFLEEPLLFSSPKPIKATPPNVIKPQPVVFTSPAKSTTPPHATDLHLAKPLTVIPRQPVVPEAGTSHKLPDPYHDDNFGFEPLYESLSHYSQMKGTPHVKNTDSPQADINSFVSSGTPVTPDSENAHKSNSKFFKSLLKRDPKRLPVNEESQRTTQSSAYKSVSAPFTKVRNTFVQKLSGSGNSKKSSTDYHKDYSNSNQHYTIETLQKPAQGLSELETLPYHVPDRDTANYDSSRGGEDVQVKNHINYQNVCFPTQVKQPEGLTHNSNSLEVPLNYPRSIYREGHESIPSTVSSLQSSRGKSRSNYLGNILQGYNDPVTQHETYNKNSPSNNKNSEGDINATGRHIDKRHTDNIDNETGSVGQASQARIRAPIALGSNISISEAYGKSTENPQIQTGGNSNTQPSNLDLIDQNEEKTSSSHGGVKSSVSDPKWVKASSVPVYKAKLIPNYENQSKYDPLFDGGVRGKAEAVAPVTHVPQVSISSDIYREELQKKSEQYVGGGIYPSAGHTPAGSGNNSLRGSMGQTYTILPSKPGHYHASPVTVTQNAQGVSTLPNNISHVHLLSSTNVPEFPQDAVRNQTCETQNNPENGEAMTASLYPSEQVTQASQSSRLDFISPSDLTSNFGRKIHIAKSSSALPLETDKDSKFLNENFPAFRSSSAHSILDRNNESRKRARDIHSAHSSPESHQYKSQSHRSRRDAGGKKITPTTQRGHGDGNHDAPQSVTSLIDKFEKGNQSGVGLLNISDKPPSMTSTPVVRRKNQETSTTQSTNLEKLVPTKSNNGNIRSHSETSRRSHSQKEIVISRWQKEDPAHKQVGRNHSLPNQSSSRSKNQAYFHQSHTHSGSHPQSHIFSAQSEDYLGNSQHTRKYQQNYDYQNPTKQTPGHRENHDFQTSETENQNYLNKYQMPSSKHNSRIHYTNDDKIMSQAIGDRNLMTFNRVPGHIAGNTGQGLASNDRGERQMLKEGPHQSHTASKQHQSHLLKHSTHSPGNQSSSNSFQPNPEIQNPNIHDSPLSQQQHHFGLFNPDQHPSQQTDIPNNINQYPSQQTVIPNYDNLPQWDQQRQSPQVSYSATLAPQQPFNNLPPGSNARNITLAISSNGRYGDDFNSNSKSVSALSEHPLQTGTKYGRHPGAMAVVKPTIMKI